MPRTAAADHRRMQQQLQQQPHYRRRRRHRIDPSLPVATLPAIRRQRYRLRQVRCRLPHLGSRHRLPPPPPHCHQLAQQQYQQQLRTRPPQIRATDNGCQQHWRQHRHHHQRQLRVFLPLPRLPPRVLIKRLPLLRRIPLIPPCRIDPFHQPFAFHKTCGILMRIAMHPSFTFPTPWNGIVKWSNRRRRPIVATMSLICTFKVSRPLLSSCPTSCRKSCNGWIRCGS